MFQLFSTATTLVAFCIGITSAVPTTINGEIIVHHAEQPHSLTKAKPAFNRFGVIVLENQDFDAAMEDPYMGTELRKKVNSPLRFKVVRFYHFSCTDLG